jgi:hypothetical protein
MILCKWITQLDYMVLTEYEHFSVFHFLRRKFDDESGGSNRTRRRVSLNKKENFESDFGINQNEPKQLQ